MTNVPKQQASPFSTGSGGAAFEVRVQAAFTVLMLTGCPAPCLPDHSMYKLSLQGRWDKFSTDDLIVYARQDRKNSEAKLLAQIKHDIAITASDKTFADVIRNAWSDFLGGDFDANTDRIALITGPLSSTNTNHVRPILEWARHSASAAEFFQKVDTPHLSSGEKRNKLEAFRAQLEAANGGVDVEKEQFWKFLKVFHLIGYDLDTEAGGTLALLHSLIARYAGGSAQLVWSRVVDAVQSRNQDAGTVTLGTLPADIVDTFGPSRSSSWSGDVMRLEEHGRYILEGIRTTVGGVHVEQEGALTQLVGMTEASDFIFVTGERGAGKSSLVREFSRRVGERAPLFCLRTEDLDQPHLDHVFSAIGLEGSLGDLEAGFALMPRKYLIIESLEKVLELEHQAAFTDLLMMLRKQGGWRIVATGRSYAYQPLTFHYLQPSGVNFTTLSLEGFSDDQVRNLCQEVPTLRKLADNPVLTSLLKTPFLADLAHRVLATGAEFSPEDGEREFRAAVWREVIAKEQQRTNGLPAKRKRTFIEVAVARAKRMVYGVPQNDFDSEALFKLEEDNLIRREPGSGLVGPAHDVLEDWALEQFIEDAYQKYAAHARAFFDAIGHEPAMNRAFRLWLHRKLRSASDANSFVHAVLGDKNLQSHWQDATIAAVLQGENPEAFFETLNDALFEDGGGLLKRFCFVLRTACQTPDRTRSSSTTFNHLNVLVDTLFLEPFGGGWEALIRFVYERRARVYKTLRPHVTAVLSDWASALKVDEPLPKLAREAGLLATHLLKTLKDSHRDEDRKKLLTVMIRTAAKHHKEFSDLLDSDVFVKSSDWRERRPAYVKDFCKLAFSLVETSFFCKHAPDLLIRLAKREWLFEIVEEEPRYTRSRINVAECFGLHEYRQEFFPASGLKGPVRDLLKFHPAKGLDFILELANRSAEKYAHSDLDAERKSSSLNVDLLEPQVDKIDICLNDGTVVRQFCSGRLWAAYRGHSVAPYLLQSALMALENWLVDYADTFDSDSVERLFDYILRMSNSVMPTAVLASVATGFPDKAGRASLPLLRTPELYLMDMHRGLRERGKSEIDWFAMSFDPYAEIYAHERREAALRPWRGEVLETLVCRLQFSELKEDALTAIDMLRESVPDRESYRFLLHRIDSRGWEAVPGPNAGTITFKPKAVEDDLLAIQNETQQELQQNSRFLSLDLWARLAFGRETAERRYYESSREALAEAKALLEMIRTGGTVSDLPGMYGGGIVTAAAVLLRDHRHDLEPEDVAWCVDLVCHAVMAHADSEHPLDSADATDFRGAAAAATVLPIVLTTTSEDDQKWKIKRLIARALTHTNKTVRHGAADGVRDYLWDADLEFAQSCVEGTIEYARYLNTSSHESRELYYLEGAARDSLAAKLQAEKDELRDQIARGALSADTSINFRSHDARHVLVPCLMIPEGSTRTEHAEFFSQMLEAFGEEEQQKYKHSSETEDDRVSYEVPLEFARHFVKHLLSLDSGGFTRFLVQLRSACQSAPDFLDTINIHMAAEAERRGKVDLFWQFFSELSGTLQNVAVEIASDISRTKYVDEKRKLVRNMLKSDVSWQAVDFENQNIALGKEPILRFVTNAGKNPDVFEALAKLMHYFPAIFFEPGIHILAKHQKEQGGTQLLSGVNTAFYLERAIQRFLQFDSTGALPRAIYESCLVLLDAVVETASARAYYLREHLVRSRKIV